MDGRFVPRVDITRDREDTNSHMSDFLLQLPASASVSYNNSALATLSQAQGDRMRNVPSLHLISSQTV